MCLVSHGTLTLKAKIGNGWTVFHWACSNGYLKLVKILTEKFYEVLNLYSKDGDGRTAFHWASQNGHLDVLEILMNTPAPRVAPPPLGVN